MTRGARPRFFCALWAAMLVFTALAAGAATAATTAAGRWAGEIDTPDGKKAEIYLVLDQKDGAWTGSLEDPLQGSAAVTGLKVTATTISFKFQPQGAPFAANFSGTYVAGDDRVSGTFALQGASRFVKFKRVGAPAGSAPAAVAGAAGAAGAAAVAAAPDTSAAAVRTKHPYRLAISGRMAWWASLHSVKDEQYTINNLTASAPAFDGAVKWFVLDGFSVFVRGVRAGQNMSDDPERLAAYAANGLTADSYLSLDGIEVGVTGYLGAKLMPRSHFNPYLTGGAGRYQWTMTSAGRGTDPLTIELQALEGTDMGGWFGMGTEYALGEKLALDFEWAWRFFLTRDTKTWRDSEDEWGNTLAWAMSAGVTYGF
ncbi:MAG: hypothetical protein IPP62_04355 [bacterium]|jgi:hypothetical protein|nr:hypothetical protein [bacterium]